MLRSLEELPIELQASFVAMRCATDKRSGLPYCILPLLGKSLLDEETVSTIPIFQKHDVKLLLMF